MVNFGVVIPNNYIYRETSPKEIKDFIVEAERLGFSSLWVLERLNHEGPMLDPLLTLAYAAQITEKPRLGTAVVVLPLHDPVMLAKSIGTLDYLSGGRVTLGLGLGSRPEELAAVGRDLKDRPSILEESLAVMRKLWAEDNVTMKTKFRSLENISVNPKPIQKPHPPILIGGLAENEIAMRRAATMSDGYLAGTRRTPEQLADAWRKVSKYAREAGRNPDDLECAIMTYCYMDKDREKASRKLQSRLGYYYMIAPTNVRSDPTTQAYGTASDCLATVEAYVKAGAKSVILVPVDADLGQLRGYEREILRSF